MSRFRMMLCLPLALALLASGTVAGPAILGDAPATLADERKDESGSGDDRQEEGDGGEADEEKDGKDEGKDDERGGPVEPAAAYRVAVECAYDADADETTCAFTGVAPADAKDVSHVDLPASDVCAEVVGGEHEYVDPDPNTRVVGYKSRGSEGAFTLVMTGAVSTGGTATYWFKTGDGVFPATGPGLACGETGVADQAAPTRITVTLEEVDQPETVATGAILVQVFACAESPDSPSFDWYGGCEPGGEGVPFTLAASEGTDPAAAEGATDAEGVLRLERLEPRAYDLEAPETVWCHAESDGVNARGEVVVAAGDETRVWIFLCGAEETK